MIYVFYRHYNIETTDNKGRPGWFDFQKCFLNFLKTIEGNKNIEFHVVMDGFSKSNFIRKYEDKFILHEIKAGNDQSSYFQTWDIAKSINMEENDLVYFLENDYLHIENWVEKVKEIFDKYNPLHYISLYDHNDKYFLPMYENLTSKILTTDTHHWRTTPSTCGSFIINRKLFDLDYDVHTTVQGDHNKFIQLNNERGRAVITPLPGLSTHCMEGLMSPTINWEQIND